MPYRQLGIAVRWWLGTVFRTVIDAAQTHALDGTLSAGASLVVDTWATEVVP
jgi:hypothetical protein